MKFLVLGIDTLLIKNDGVELEAPRLRATDLDALNSTFHVAANSAQLSNNIFMCDSVGLSIKISSQ
jgi:hypothetical protein